MTALKYWKFNQKRDNFDLIKLVQVAFKHPLNETS
jgi:hypothetical protein